jgi:hypothetical protein
MLRVIYFLEQAAVTSHPVGYQFLVGIIKAGPHLSSVFAQFSLKAWCRKISFAFLHYSGAGTWIFFISHGF